MTTTTTQPSALDGIRVSELIVFAIERGVPKVSRLFEHLVEHEDKFTSEAEVWSAAQAYVAAAKSAHERFGRGLEPLKCATDAFEAALDRGADDNAMIDARDALLGALNAFSEE